jgi:hypothetical protein
VEKWILSMPKESKKVKSHTKSTLFLTILLLQTKQFISITSRRFYNETGSLLKLSKHWQNQDWVIHYTNVAVHTASSVQQFLAAKNMPVVLNLFTCPI